MLALGFAWYRYGQQRLRKDHRDEKGALTEGFVGPVGFLICAAVVCALTFGLLRALVRGEVPCVGRACKVPLYTLAANAGEYWATMFYLAWIVLATGYAMYVTFKIWFRV